MIRKETTKITWGFCEGHWTSFGCHDREPTAGDQAASLTLSIVAFTLLTRQARSPLTTTRDEEEWGRRARSYSVNQD